jgi:hypothetical protein
MLAVVRAKISIYRHDHDVDATITGTPFRQQGTEIPFGQRLDARALRPALCAIPNICKRPLLAMRRGSRTPHLQTIDRGHHGLVLLPDGPRLLAIELHARGPERGHLARRQTTPPVA